MKRSQVLVAAFCALAAASAYATNGNEGPSPGPNHHPHGRLLLERVETDGPGQVVNDISIFEDGTVIETSSGTTQIVGTLGAGQVARIESSIESIQQEPLVKVDPNQYPNPGGFVVRYELYQEGGTDPASGTEFTFAENVSGVDFGLPNQQGDDLKALLDGYTRQ